MEPCETMHVFASKWLRYSGWITALYDKLDLIKRLWCFVCMFARRLDGKKSRKSSETVVVERPKQEYVRGIPDYDFQVSLSFGHKDLFGSILVIGRTWWKYQLSFWELCHIPRQHTIFFSFLQVGTLNFIRSKAPSAVTNGRDEDKKESSFTAFQGKGKSLRQAKSSGQK